MADSLPSEQTAAFTPFEVVNPDGDARILLLCDHASNAVPPGYGDLGIPPEDFTRHIAYDVGVDRVTRELARMLDCPGVLGGFSRLFIDPNRAEDDPTLVMKLSDGSVIPGNRHVDDAEIERRLDLCYRPYNRAIEAAIARARQRIEASPVLISIHSFTPQLRGRPARPWHVSVLWDKDAGTAHALIDRLRREDGLIVGDNEPYHGSLEGDCLWRHGTSQGLRNALLEIRNDQIGDEAGQIEWAARLASVLRDALA